MPWRIVPKFRSCVSCGGAIRRFGGLGGRVTIFELDCDGFVSTFHEESREEGWSAVSRGTSLEIGSSALDG